MKWGIFVNENKRGSKKIINHIEKFAKKQHIELIFEKSALKFVDIKKTTDAESVCKKSDIIFAIGGDGTVLRTARFNFNDKKPLIGINIGGFGFLTEIPETELNECLESIVDGNYKIGERTTLDCCVKSSDQTSHVKGAFNEIVLSKQNISRVICMSVYVNNKFVTEYMADGIIVSTPTGSTAYSLSAGGPIVSPDAEVFLIMPICAHMLTHRPLVISDSDTVKLVVNEPSKEILLTVDGQICKNIKTNDRVDITKSKYKVPLVTLRKNTYYDVLREKLHWGRRSRKKI